MIITGNVLWYFLSDHLIYFIQLKLQISQVNLNVDWVSLWFQFSGTPQKHGLAWACVLCLPCPSSSGSQELDERALPGAVRLLPSTVPASVTVRTGQV